MKTTNITVILVDDHQLFREGISFLIEQMENVSILAEASNDIEFQELLLKHEPDIVLLDLDLPGKNGVEILKDIRAENSDLMVVILTMHDDPKMMTYLMELGANGYLLKDTNSKELQTAIETVHNEGIYASAQLSKALLSSLKSNRPRQKGANPADSITNREKEVLKLISKGHTAKEIAEILFISQRTAEGHRKNLIAKLGVTNTATLIVKAIKENLVE